MRCLAEVSIRRELNCLANSRPSVENGIRVHVSVRFESFSTRSFPRITKRTMCRHLAFRLEIALVGNKDDREKVLVLDAQNLLVESRDLLERVARCNRVNKQETLSAPRKRNEHTRNDMLASSFIPWHITQWKVQRLGRCTGTSCIAHAWHYCWSKERSGRRKFKSVSQLWFLRRRVLCSKKKERRKVGGK